MPTAPPASAPDPAPAQLTAANLAFAEEMYARYLADPGSVDDSWRALFTDGLAAAAPASPVPAAAANGHPGPGGHGANGHNGAAALRPLVEGAHAVVEPAHHHLRTLDSHGPLTHSELQERVHQLIAAYWVRGYRFAHLDPLGLAQVPENDLGLESFGLPAEALGQSFPTGYLSGPQTLTLAEIVSRLEETYCRSIGVEFRQVEEPLEKEWLRERMEATCNRLTLSAPDQRRILTKLTDAEIFEQFLHTKFVGAKRFSLEGAESLIPLMELIIEGLGAHGIKEIVIAMAHRGRLNVLANVLQRNPRAIFAEFADEDPTAYLGSGDVKYHLGHSSDRVTSSGQPVHLSLAFNPSHLEWVDAVALGRVRAKQDRLGDHERRKVVPLIIHGEAAFAGQGIVAELLNASGLEGYTVGGTIHVIVNNQIGFTTSPDDARSTPYATDVARMLRVPIFHVNGEDPEAVAQVVKLAVDFRMAFHKDVFIDMYCYRRHGHNETDEPAFTQPLMAAAIARKPTVRQIYVEKLTALGQITRAEADDLARQRRQALDEALAETRRGGFREKPSAMAGLWALYRGGADADTPDVATRVPREHLVDLVQKLTTLPEGFSAHPKIRKLLDQRRAMAPHDGGTGAPVDWGTGEALAFATLLTDAERPASIRLSGQDSRRGTFSHRHAVLRDVTNGQAYTPLEHLSGSQARFDVYDSPLSEASVLGFDFGFSLDYPDGLVLWEAQFGDFANSAQVVIDQFISSAEDKWRRLSGLVMLLPHGFEGQGPEHSSARLERFLQLCAEDNMQVCNVTTPAQYFHLLRRQVLRPLRKPLVVMAPKSLLRHRDCVSPLGDFSDGGFQRVIPDRPDRGDEGQANPSRITTGGPFRPPSAGGAVGAYPHDVIKWVLLCSGKIYYELAAAREVAGADHVAIVRLEQIYPLPEEALVQALAPYRPGTQLVWVQEEPWNMGAWYYLRARCPRRITQRWPLSCIARAESASPASGSHASHNLEQELLIERAFTIGSDPVG